MYHTWNGCICKFYFNKFHVLKKSTKKNKKHHLNWLIKTEKKGGGSRGAKVEWADKSLG